jgi:hypothetical protein
MSLNAQPARVLLLLGERRRPEPGNVIFFKDGKHLWITSS